jgi:hypothetical protein
MKDVVLPDKATHPYCMMVPSVTTLKNDKIAVSLYVLPAANVNEVFVTAGEPVILTVINGFTIGLSLVYLSNGKPSVTPPGFVVTNATSGLFAAAEPPRYMEIKLNPGVQVPPPDKT